MASLASYRAVPFSFCERTQQGRLCQDTHNGATNSPAVRRHSAVDPGVGGIPRRPEIATRLTYSSRSSNAPSPSRIPTPKKKSPGGVSADHCRLWIFYGIMAMPPMHRRRQHVSADSPEAKDTVFAHQAPAGFPGNDANRFYTNAAK